MRPRNSIEGRPTVLLSSSAQEVRLRYLYQDLVLRGRARISLDAARGLVGPDRAFHLYALLRSRTKKYR